MPDDTDSQNAMQNQSEDLRAWLRAQPEDDSLDLPVGDELCDVCGRAYDSEGMMVVDDVGTVCFHCLYNLARRQLAR